MPDQRRLTAIMFTDLVGYTKLMGRDEGEARAVVERSRAHIREFVERFEGEYLEEPGDSTLSSFPSAMDATGCALAIQESLNEGSQMQLRIGIHSGDVVFSDGHVYGDGVNVAARLEPLAKPGGILVSETIRDAIRGHPDAHARYLGSRRLKNVADPVRIYALEDGSNASGARSAHGNGLDRLSWLRPVLYGALIVVLGGVLWLEADRFLSGGTNPGSRAGTAGIPEQSIAVLPFENLSDDKQNAYFVAGIQDLILSKLANISDLKVISRTSTEQYGSRPGNLKQVAAELGVTTILEGSVQKVGNEVLINVQLIDARKDSHLWSESYHRTLDNIFGVEGEVAGKIAAALKAELSPEEAARLARIPTTNRAAYDLFLRAEYQADRGLANLNSNLAILAAAIPLYRQAIARDPGFALAYARLSYVESVLAWFGGGGHNPKELFVQARSNAERALELEPDLAAAHVAMGYSDYYGKGDYAAALEAFGAALALSPNDAGALAARGYVERRQGRFEASIASLQEALAHDPRNSQLAFNLGTTSMLVSRYGEAKTWLQRALALDPNHISAKGAYASAILLGSGDIPRALAAAQGDAPGLKLQRSYLLTWQRKYAQAIALLENVPDTPGNFSRLGGSKALQLAELYRLAGEAAKARALFEEALPQARAELDRWQGINLAFAWHNVARAELGLGHTREGLDAIAESQAIVAESEDQVYGPGIMAYNASLYAQAGRPDLAVPLLAKALTTPGIGWNYSPVLLWLDPNWDPIRDEPGFQALLKQYAEYEPVVM